MSDPLARRVGRLVSGGFHALIDAAENSMPEASMNEAIREVERTLDDVKQELGKVSAQKHLANKRLIDENNRHEALLDNIQAALTQSRDDLAAAGIAEQMDIEARIPVLESTIASCVAQEKELEAFVVALQAKNRQMQQQLRDWLHMQKVSQSSSNQTSDPSTRSLQQQGEAASRSFDRVWEKQTGIQADAGPTDASKVRELEELGRKHRIEERLAALKAQK